jgi:DNA (cytosine-5)-methyltransferase 1
MKGEARRLNVAEDVEKPVPSGWPAESRERGDFLHPPRLFPPSAKKWRTALAARAREDRKLFPGLRNGLSIVEVRAFLDEGLAHLREVDRLAAMLHGSPTLGNKRDAVDELVYIMLSRKTRERAYQDGFAALKEAFPTWDALLAAPPSRVGELIASGGLVRKKADAIRGSLAIIKKTFGTCTLEPLRTWDDERATAFLCSLPEVSRKTAYCVLMYSLGREVLPVDTHVGRVLQRIGPFVELGLSLAGLDHKRLQLVLQDVIPPALRYSLHVNLVAHGRSVCRAVRPLCEICELRPLCGRWRSETAAARVPARSTPLVVDLFAGAGGLSEGLHRAGFATVAAVDLDPVAVKTYRLNHPEVAPENVIARDIKDVSAAEIRRAARGRRIDVLAGAPPCQGFSRVGMRSKGTLTGYSPGGDRRNYLFEYLVALALKLKPRLFLMENVPGMETAQRENLGFVEAARRILERKGGYRTDIWRLNAAAFGVPQERRRCFLVAAARGIEMPSCPRGDYQDARAGDFDVDALPPTTFDEATFDLPRRAAAEGTAVDPKPQAPLPVEVRARRYLDKFKLRETSPFVFNHFVRYQNPRDLELYAPLRPGQDSIHAVEVHGRGDLMRYRRDVFDDKYARLRGDRPSKTIVAHLAKDGNGYIHPHQVRSISIREAARLQSFPDKYIFCGSPSDQWVQIGNAVPPLLAQSIAKSFLSVLGGKKQ